MRGAQGNVGKPGPMVKPFNKPKDKNTMQHATANLMLLISNCLIVVRVLWELVVPQGIPELQA